MAPPNTPTTQPHVSIQHAGSDAQAIIDTVKDLSSPVRSDIADTPGVAQIAIIPKGMEIKSLQEHIDAARLYPLRKRGITTLTSLEAFCAFVNRHKTKDSIVFLDDLNPQKPQLIGVLNPHKPEALTEDGSPPEAAGEKLADHGDHKALYKFPLAPEWLAWTAELPAQFNQADFAEFLEKRITDVTEPKDLAKQFAQEIGVALATASTLMELSRGLAITVDQRVTNAVNTSNGTGQIFFTEEHKDQAGAPLKVPGAFSIAIPVFRLGGRFEVPVRLRYRREGSRVVWMLQPQKLDKVWELSLQETQDLIESRTGLPVFRGAP